MAFGNVQLCNCATNQFPPFLFKAHNFFSLYRDFASKNIKSITLLQTAHQCIKHLLVLIPVQFLSTIILWDSLKAFAENL